MLLRLGDAGAARDTGEAGNASCAIEERDDDEACVDRVDSDAAAVNDAAAAKEAAAVNDAAAEVAAWDDEDIAPGGARRLAGVLASSRTVCEARFVRIGDCGSTWCVGDSRSNDGRGG